jgi:transcriptional regulator with XRE-family HTH domain
MKVCEKIHFLRQLKNWSQEEMASKLEMSVNGYAKIERGETDVPVSRLEQIAKVFEVELVELLSFGEKNIFYVTGDNTLTNSCCQFGNNTHFTSQPDQERMQFEIEKLNLIVQQQMKEIECLKEIIQLLKKTEL